ncbi:MAG: hypothetical protein EA399_10465 [Desulfovibrionales bacterium]|nr:MAG: hypothetical protein EA399_10465 [Desulfovibrionales bacterium]
MPLVEPVNALRRRYATPQAVWVCGLLFCFFLGSIFLSDNIRLHRNVYYILVLVPFAVLVRGDFFQALIRSPVFLGCLAFLGYLWLSLFWSSQDSNYVFYNEARTLVLMLGFLAVTAFYAVHLEGFTKLLGWVLAVTAAAASMISIYVFYVDRHIPLMGGLESRVVDIGLAGHPIDSAGLYGFVAIFLVFALVLPRRKHPLATWAAVASLLAILAFVALTQTRGALLGIGMVLGFGLMLHVDRRLWLVLGVLFATVLGMVAVSLHHPEGMFGFERRLGVRGEIWTLALERAWERPWFGFGLNEHHQLFSADGERHGVAHNLYLENLHFGGIFGTALLLGLAGLALRGAWRDYRRTGSFLMPAIISYPLIFGISAGYLTLSKISPMWIQFWLPIGLIIATEIRNGQTWKDTCHGAGHGG